MARDLKDYVEVHERVEAFWNDHPDDGSIITHMEYPDEHTVRCHVRILTHGVLRATGHAEEVRGQGLVNTTSAVENCETSAVGRALAVMGYKVKRGIASREEVAAAVAAQAQAKPKGLQGPSRNGRITDKQQKLVWARARQHGLNNEQVLEVLQRVAKVDRTELVARDKLDEVLEAFATAKPPVSDATPDEEVPPDAPSAEAEALLDEVPFA